MDTIIQAIVDDMDKEEFDAYIRAIKKRFNKEAGVKAASLVDSKESLAWMQTIAREGAISAIRQVRKETKEPLVTCKMTVDMLEEIHNVLLPLEMENVKRTAN